MLNIQNDDYSRYIRNKPFEVGDTLTFDLNYLKIPETFPCIRTGKVIAVYKLVSTNQDKITKYVYKVNNEQGIVFDVDHNSVIQCYREC